MLLNTSAVRLSCLFEIDGQTKMPNKFVYLGGGLDGSKITKYNFPLGNLALKLKTFSDQVFSGKGFARISGLDPAKFSKEDNVMIFLGISSHFGETRGKQDDDGNMIGQL